MATITPIPERLTQWATEFIEGAALKENGRRMTEKETRDWVSLMFLEQKEEPLGEEVTSTFAWKLINTRAPHAGVTLTPPLTLFLAIASVNPGTAVMYLYALGHHQRTTGKVGTALRFSDFAEVFPLQIPNEDFLRAMWEKQKDHGQGVDNFLDKVSLV